MTALIIGGIVAALGAGAGAYFWMNKAKVTKLKLIWAKHQLIFSGMAYNWWKLSASKIAEMCEYVAANGWTAVGVELQAKAMWWPKDRMAVQDFKAFMRSQVDDLEPLVKECRKRKLILKIVGVNTNGDLNRQVKQTGIIEDSQNYFVQKYGTDGIMWLACSETDTDTLGNVRSSAITNAERLFSREQTVAYAKGRGDCAFTEHHPARPNDIPSPHVWSTLVVSDNGGTLRHMHADGVTGNRIEQPAADNMFNGWIDSGVSTELYAFWTSWEDKKDFLKRIGKRFEAKHGSRKA